MNQPAKKKLIAALLLAACLLSGWILLEVPPSSAEVHLNSVSQADSLLQRSFSDYDIFGRQISTSSTQVDSSLNRKTFILQVPSDFPDTRFHLDMKQQLAPYHISVPARVIFPDRDMHIYLIYRHTVIRTVILKVVQDDENDKQSAVRLGPLPVERYHKLAQSIIKPKRHA